MFNEWYAKDTSKKIRAVMKSKGEAGEHLCSNPPYGYMKDPDNKKHWIVDEEAAKVVRRIFRLCLEGYYFRILIAVPTAPGPVCAPTLKDKGL